MPYQEKIVECWHADTARSLLIWRAKAAITLALHGDRQWRHETLRDRVVAAYRRFDRSQPKTATAMHLHRKSARALLREAGELEDCGGGRWREAPPMATRDLLAILGCTGCRCFPWRRRRGGAIAMMVAAERPHRQRYARGRVRHRAGRGATAHRREDERGVGIPRRAIGRDPRPYPSADADSIEAARHRAGGDAVAGVSGHSTTPVLLHRGAESGRPSPHSAEHWRRASAGGADRHAQLPLGQVA